MWVDPSPWGGATPGGWFQMVQEGRLRRPWGASHGLALASAPRFLPRLPLWWIVMWTVGWTNPFLLELLWLWCFSNRKKILSVWNFDSNNCGLKEICFHGFIFIHVYMCFILYMCIWCALSYPSPSLSYWTTQWASSQRHSNFHSHGCLIMALCGFPFLTSLLPQD